MSRDGRARCACEDRHHTLMFTSLLFLLPAARLLAARRVMHAALLAMHALTSVLFHATHDVRVKRFDVALTRIVFAFAALWGARSPVVFVCLVYVTILWYNPLCHERGCLQLRAHACMHLVAAWGLLHLPK